MSSKRRATTELTSDNWDKEDSDPEEPGEFAQVDQARLAQRVVKKAKRSLNTSADLEAKPSPFAGFAGFTKKLSSTSPPPTFTLGATVTTAAASVPPPAPTPSVAASAPVRPQQYFHSLKILNESLLSWLRQHFDKNPFCDFTPVFKDYISHYKNLEQKYPPVSPSKKSEEATTTTKPETSTTATTTTAAAATVVGGGKTNGFGPVSSTSSPFFSSSSATTSTPPPSLFLSSTFTTTSTSSPQAPIFSFVTKPLSAEATKTFSFATHNPPVSGGGGEAADTKEEEEYTPPAPEKGFVEEDALYTVRCKLFYKSKDGQFVERGVGNLVILQQEDGKSQLVVRMATALGNPLLNIRLSSSLPMQRVASNNVMIMCVPNPPWEGVTQPISALLRVKGPAEADQLLQQLNKYKN